MKNKIIFWGHVKEGDKVHLVSWDGETGSQYHKINGTLVEYAVVASLGQLKEELATKKPVIFCIDHRMELDWSMIEKKCEKILYIPQMSQLELNDLVETALFSTKVYLDQKRRLAMAGMEANAEHIAMQLLHNFRFIEKAKRYELIIGGSENLAVDEISKVEDVMKEYSQEGSTFYIEQVELNKKREGYCFLLHIEE